LPTAVTISVSNGTLNEVHIDVDPTSNNSVTIEHDGSSAASPGATALKIGETNPDDASADTRANDDPALRGRSLNADDATVNNSLSLGTDTALTSVVASGSIQLSSGSATVDTRISESTTATFMVAFGPATDDADVAADIRAASGGNYEVDVQETDTSIGNPTVEYDIIRVR